MKDARYISCQTDLSFDPEDFLRRLVAEGTDLSTIRLQAIYHPERVLADTFAEKAHLLYQAGIDLCAGATGLPEHKALIGGLREMLSPEIYLFVDAPQGTDGQLTDDDIRFYTAIDPLFSCGCRSLSRIPEKRRVKAFFFDIDGTLTDSDRQVPERYRRALSTLSLRVPLYFATSRPLVLARQRLGRLFYLFSGGVFADGGHICYGETDEYVFLEREPELDSSMVHRVKRYHLDGKVYKYVLLATSVAAAGLLSERLAPAGYRLYQEGRLLTITDRRAGKRNGFLTLCQRLGISPADAGAIGNTLHDLPLLEVAGYPCAVINAEEELRQAVSFILNPDHLPAFFTGV